MTRFSPGTAALHWLFLPILACAVFVNLTTAVTAQSSSACVLPPLTVPLFDATPPAVIAATPIVNHEPPPTEADIQPSVEQFIVCANTGDPNLGYAVFTPRYLADQFTDRAGHYLPAFEQSLATGVAPVDGQLELVGTSDFNVLVDLRVQVVIEARNRTETFADEVILAKVGDFWLVDGLVNLNSRTRTT